MPTRAELPVSLIVILLTFAAAFVRLYGLGEWDYYLDEYWHVYVSRQPTLSDVFYENLIRDGHPILPYFLWHWLLDIWNDPWMARLPSLIAGVLCVPMGYFLGKEMLGGKNGGLFAAFFMAFSGVLIIQSNVVRGYMLSFLFCTAALWCVCRYARRPQILYLLLYFISFGLALLCEFGVLCLAPFMALYLLYTIYTHRQWPALILWGGIHMVFLIYLWWFRHLLLTLGMTSFDQALVFTSHQTGILGFLYHSLYFLSFIYTSNVSAPFLSGNSYYFTDAILFIIYLCIAIAGIDYIIRHRLRLMAAVLCSSVLVLIFLHYMGFIPLSFPRRNIGFLIPCMVLFYYGCVYVGVHGFKLRTNVFSASYSLLAATVLLVTIYGFQGEYWRKNHMFEFQQTKRQTQEIFTFLNAEVRPHDIIVTDWLSYISFWSYHKQCVPKPLSKQISYYDCYAVPVYVVEEDYRSSIFLLNIEKMQRVFQEMDRMGYLHGVKRVWLAGIQHMSAKMYFLDTTLIKRMPKLLDPKQMALQAESIAQFTQEHQQFLDFAYRSANPQLVAKADNCDLSKDTEKCEVRLALLALPTEMIYKHIINLPRFFDPVRLFMPTPEHP